MRNAEGFDAFYAASVRRVTGQLYLMTGSQTEADDSVQEAYARAWQRWGRVSGYDDPEAWVRTVAYRVSVDSCGATCAAGSRTAGTGRPATSLTSARTGWRSPRPCAASRRPSGRRSCSITWPGSLWSRWHTRWGCPLARSRPGWHRV
ncbi:MAG TPA: sigma factor [Streptosporangiaceae bacterium]|nr:sigma factor [Streptosporangiaceae bacterium]